MKWRSDNVFNFRGIKNEYRSENDFMCNKIDYERDEDNGRCYKLVASCNLRSEMNGALVRRRISEKEFEERKSECLQAIEKYEQWLVEVGYYETEAKS